MLYQRHKIHLQWRQKYISEKQEISFETRGWVSFKWKCEDNFRGLIKTRLTKWPKWEWGETKISYHLKLKYHSWQTKWRSLLEWFHAVVISGALCMTIIYTFVKSKLIFFKYLFQSKYMFHAVNEWMFCCVLVLFMKIELSSRLQSIRCPYHYGSIKWCWRKHGILS